MQLNQVKAIITGGASGLGHAVAQHLVANGGTVALFDVNEEKGQEAAKALKGHFFRTDVTSEEGVSANVAAAREELGELQVLHLGGATLLELLGPEGAKLLPALEPLGSTTIAFNNGVIGKHRQHRFQVACAVGVQPVNRCGHRVKGHVPHQLP